jgi:hypothetical protein
MICRFGVEFAPEVVQADGNVRNLAWRICNAKKVLVGLMQPLHRSSAVTTWSLTGVYRHRTACPRARAGTRLRFASRL